MFSSVLLLIRVGLFATPWTAARQASLSITNSQSLPKLVSIESVMPSKHLILCHPLLLLPSIFPNIRVFSNESTLCIRWPKYWSFSFNISPSYEHPGLISFRMDCLNLLVVQGTLKSLLQRLCVHVLFAKRKSLCVWSKTWAEPLGSWAGRDLHRSHCGPEDHLVSCIGKSNQEPSLSRTFYPNLDFSLLVLSVCVSSAWLRNEPTAPGNSPLLRAGCGWKFRGFLSDYWSGGLWGPGSIPCAS